MKNKFVKIFYILFILLSSLSVIFIPQALEYPLGSEISIIILFFPVGYILWSRFGFSFFAKTVLLLSIFALSIEYIGLTTGFPYGHFVYTGSLGYKIAGILPWTVGISWVPLMIGSVALAYCITTNKFMRILIPALILVVFDLLFDPVAVRLGFWQYLNSGAYYSVPLQNFVGWGFSGLIGSILCFYLFDSKETKKMDGLWYSFVLSVIFWIIVAIGKGLYLPACLGLILLATAFFMVRYKNNEKVY